MKTIKFREEIRQDVFYQQLRKKVQAYLAANGFDGFATWQVWLKASLYVGIFAGLYLILLFGQLTFSVALGVWAGMGFFGVLMGLNFSHDAAHNAFFKNKTLNKVLYYVTFSALGASAYLWQLRHVQSHHIFPNVDGCDADIDDNPFIRLSPHKPLRGYHKYQHIYAPVLYLAYTLVWVFIKDFVILQKRQLANLRDIHHPAMEVVLFFVAKAAYLFFMIGVPYWLLDGALGQVLIGFIVMHFAASYTFIFGLIASHFSDGRLFPKVDEEGYLDLSWSKHQVATSLDYHATKHWTNWLFGGFNAHCAHHLFPQINHVHYPKISEFIIELAPVFNLPYQNTTLPKAIAAHFRYLKQMGNQESIRGC
jgi:linoleoyl-CoA desaturase